MHTQSRIPKLRDTTFDGALMWFSEMQCCKLLFHPEDDPADIIRISSGERLFSDGEATGIRIWFGTAQIQTSMTRNLCICNSIHGAQL